MTGAPQKRHRPGWRAGRHALLASTALSAALLATPAARAAPAPQATPQGGRVVGGAASIRQGQGSETITQTSQRAAIDWQSFNVGKDAHVSIHQPNARAILLNRVIANDPSVIAGRIDANGQLILVNRSGVVFTRSAQVNAESLVVSTAGISPKNFMAGKMDFDRPPRPGARIVNRGRITMKQAGLAAFVGPIVANHGTITARLGHVELAGASAFILNASADGHIAINVTRAVRQVDLGGRKVTALVTNDGTILARGGTVTLTARALDGLVKQLLDVRGAIRADSAGGKSGTITISGIGGDLRVAGSLLAQGKGQGARGGTIAVDSTGTVTVADHARLDASGQAGGGVIAIGTDARRAATGPRDTTAPRAKAVTIEKDAAIHADATASGDGGTVTLLSASRTDQGGTITARGAGAGHGGTAEISSDGVISLSGTENVDAASGHAGTVTLDPKTLVVDKVPPHGTTASISGTTTIGGTATSAAVSYVDPKSLSSIAGTLVLEAASLISIPSSPTLSSSLTALTLDSLGAVSVAKPISLSGSLEIDANGIIDIAASLTAGNMTLHDLGAQATGVTISAPVSVGTLLAAEITSGGLTETGSGIISAPTLTSAGGSIGGDVSLASITNSITTLSDVTTTGTLDLGDTGGLTLGGNISVSNATLDPTGGLFEATSPTTLSITTLTDAAAGTGLFLNGPSATNKIGTLDSFSAPKGHVVVQNASSLTIKGLDANTILLDASGILTLDGPVIAATLLTLGGSGIDETTAGLVDARTLASTGTIAGAVNLPNNNTIGTVQAISATGSILLDDTAPLTVAGPLTAGNSTTNSAITLRSTGTSAGDISIAAAISATGALDIETDATGGKQANGVTIAAPVSANGVTVTDRGANSSGVTISNAVSAGHALTATIDHGGLTETTNGHVTAGTLTSGAGSIGGDVILTNGNSIDTLADVTVANGSLALGDTAATGLAIAGTDSATNITLNATALAIDGSLRATGTSPDGILSLSSTGDIVEASTGAIDASLLTGTAPAGIVSLAGNNSIDTVAGFTAGGSLDLQNGTNALTIANPVTAHGITLGSGDLTIDGDLHAAGTARSPSPSGTIALDSTGTISEPSTTAIDATLLTGSASGPVNLTGGNAIDTLSGFAVTKGGLDLQDANALTIAGTDSMAAFTLADSLALTGSGALDAGTLDIPGTIGSVSLTGSNAITTVQAITATGPIILDDTGALTVTGPLSAGNTTTTSALTLYTSGTNAGNIVLDGAVSATGALDIATDATGGGQPNGVTIGAPVTADSVTIADLGSHATGVVETGAGSLHAGTLTGTLQAGALLTSANSIGTLAGLTASGALALQDTTALDVTAPVSAAGISILDPATLTLGADLRAAPAGTVALALGGLAPGGGRIIAPGGLVAIAPANRTGLSIGGGNGGTLTLTGSDIGTTIGGGTTPAATVALGGATVFGTAYTAHDLSIGAAVSLAAAALDLDAATTIAIAAPVTAATASIRDGGAISETGAGMIQATALTGSVANNAILTASNGIGTLDAFTAGGTLGLVDTQVLTIAGAVSGLDVTLDVPSLAIPGTLAAIPNNGSGGTLHLTSTGGIGETGAIDAAALTGSSGNGATLTGRNSIDALANFSATGSLFLDDIAPLTIAGTDSVAGVVTLADPVSLLGTGALEAAALDIPGTIGGVSLTGGNSIVTLQTVHASNAAILTDASALTIAGSLTANTATLSANSLSVPGQISTAGTLSLTSGTGIDEAGTIDAALLTGAASAGAANLTGSNSVVVLGDFNANGAFVLNDDGPLGIAGLLSAPLVSLSDIASIAETGRGAIDAATLTGSAASNASLTGANSIATLTVFTAGTDLALNNVTSLAIAGLVTAGRTIAIGGAPTITETGSGALDAAALAALPSHAPGDVILTNANSISTLTGFTAGGNLVLDDVAPLTIAGTDSIAGGVTLADPIFLLGTGALEAAALDIPGTIGGVSLTGNNSIATLQALHAANAVILDDIGALTVAGSLSANAATLSANGLSVPGLIAATGTLSLASGTSIDETGAIDAALLTGAAPSGAVKLTGSNTITAIGPFAAGATLALDDLAGLTLAGPLTATDIGLSAPALTVNGPITTGSGSAPGTLSVASGSTIAGAGVVTTGMLQGQAGGAVSLGGANSVSAIGSFTAGGAIFLNDASPLAVEGTLRGGPVTLLADGMTIPGGISAGTALSLASGGTIVETGSITAALLTGSAARSAALTGSNSIGTLGAFAAGGDLLLNDNAALTIDAPVSGTGTIAFGSAGTIAETAAGVLDALALATLPSHALGGNVSLTNGNSIDTLAGFTAAGSLVLDDSAPLTIAGTDSLGGGVTLADPVSLLGTGALEAAALDIPGTITGVSLGGANAISILRTVDATGAVILDDTVPLAVAGPLTAGSASLAAAAITIPGTVTSGTLSLTSTGTIGETGAIDTGLLAGTAGGTAAFLGGNSIAQLGSFAGTDALILDDLAALTIAGPVSAADMTLAAASVSIAAAVTTAGTLSLASGGAILETGGIAAGLLTGSAAGAADITGTNTIATLGAFSATGPFRLDDIPALTVSGPLAAPAISLAAGDLHIPGTITTAGTLSLASGGTILGPGSVEAGLLTGTAAGAVDLSGTNTIATLAAFTGGAGFRLDDAAPLAVTDRLTATDATLAAAGLAIPGTIAATGTIALGSSGGIAETGALSAPTLTGLGTLTGPVSLGGTNTIATLNDFSVAGGPLVFTDRGGLRVTGLVSAPSITIDPPSLAIEGTIATPGDFLLGSTGSVTETGAIDAGTLSSRGAIGGPVTLDGPNAIGTLAAFDDQGQVFALRNDAPLTIVGPVVARAVTISASQTLVLDGSAGGGLFIDGQPLPKRGLLSPRPGIDSVLTVTGGSTETLLQTGTFSIDTGQASVPYGLAGHQSTVFVNLLPNATATFANLQAPKTDIVLAPGTGRVTGQVNLGYLLIVGTTAQQVRLLGKLGHIGGAAAAHNGKVQPIPQIRYTINACVIGSVSCTTIPIEVPPPTNPLDNFDIAPPKKRRLDRHVRLPNIATKDY